MSKAPIKETILVVDEVDRMLTIIVDILKSGAFNVLQADDGASAVKLANSYPGKIDLLLCGVQMREMTGPALGATIRVLRQDIHVVLMSRLAGESLLILGYGWDYIEKPFLSAKLLEIVGEILHGPNKVQNASRYDTRQVTVPERRMAAGGRPDSEWWL